MSKAWAGGSTRRWRRVRSLSFAVHGRTCTLQLPGCTGYADTAHHTEGRARTGDDPRYVRPACSPCNIRAGDPGAAAVDDPQPQPRTRW